MQAQQRQGQSQSQRAVLLMMETLERLKRGGQTRPDQILQLTQSLANKFQSLGKYDKALPYLDQMVRGLQISRGPTHEATLRALSRFSRLLMKMNRFEEAFPVEERVLEGFRALHPDDHLAEPVLRSMTRLAEIKFKGGGYRSLVHALLTVMRHGAKEEEILEALRAIATRYEQEEDLEEALLVSREIFQRNERLQGPEDPQTLTALSRMVHLLEKLEKHEEALPLMERLMHSLWEFHDRDMSQETVIRALWKLCEIKLQLVHSDAGYEWLHRHLRTIYQYYLHELPRNEERLRLVKYNYAFVLYKRRHYELALKLLKEVENTFMEEDINRHVRALIRTIQDIMRT